LQLEQYLQLQQTVSQFNFGPNNFVFCAKLNMASKSNMIYNYLNKIQEFYNDFVQNKRVGGLLTAIPLIISSTPFFYIVAK
jgi:hypothetical protein